MPISSFLFGLQGRISRRTYLLTTILFLLGFFVVVFVLMFILGFIVAIVGGHTSPRAVEAALKPLTRPIVLVTSLVSIWVAVALMKKRFNDTGQLGALAFIYGAVSVMNTLALAKIIEPSLILPGGLANCIILLLALFLPPSSGANQHGPNPRGGHAEVPAAAYRGLSGDVQRDRVFNRTTPDYSPPQSQRAAPRPGNSRFAFGRRGP